VEFTEIFDLRDVGFINEASHDASGNIPADIFVVVSLFLFFLDLLGNFPNFFVFFLFFDCFFFIEPDLLLFLGFLLNLLFLQLKIRKFKESAAGVLEIFFLVRVEVDIFF